MVIFLYNYTTAPAPTQEFIAMCARNVYLVIFLYVFFNKQLLTLERKCAKINIQ